MKIGIQTWGSRGDVMPFIALANGLQAGGHDVTLAVTDAQNKNYSATAKTLGIKLIHVYDKFEKVPKHIFREMAATRDSFKTLRLLNEYLFDPAVDEMDKASMMLCAENDIVVCHFWMHTMLTAATLHNRPRVVVTLCPLNVRTNYAPAGGLNLGPWLNGLVWDLGDHMMKKKLFQKANELRERKGLPPVKSILRELMISDDLTLIATSPSLSHKQPDWGDNIQISGFLNMPRSDSQDSLSDSLQKFLDNGNPPIFFSFGSCDEFFPEENAKLFLETIRITGERGIVQCGYESAFKDYDRSQIFFTNEVVDHARVFPQCRLIVHHGGAGTTQTVVRSGKPSIVVEHAVDQGYWGKTLVRKQVSPKLFHRRSVTPKKLSYAIKKVLQTSLFKNNSHQLGNLLRDEDGVSRAIEFINNRFT